MSSLLSRRESISILKTASNDADTLSLAHEKNANFSLSDGESVTTSKLDDSDFEFDSEIVNTAAYRNVFNKARSKLPLKKGSWVYSLLHLPSSSGAGDSTGGMRKEEHDADLENQPESTSEKSEFRIGEYSVGTTIGIGTGGKVKLAWKGDRSHQFAIKFIRREPDALGTDPPRNALRGFAILRGLSHPNIIRLHDTLETERHSAVVLDYIPGGSLAEYVAVHTRLSEYFSRKFFAQIISAVEYLHRNDMVHSTLSCSKVLLDSNQRAVLTGFSNVKTFNTQYMARFMKGQFMWGTPEDPYFNASGSSPYSFYEERQADVWSCGIILVSAQYGLRLDTNDLKYFMLAGYLPFPGGLADLGRPDARSQLYYSHRTPVTFPESFPVRAQDLVRRMLAERFIAQADLTEVAGHTWLTDYTRVVPDVIENPIS